MEPLGLLCQWKSWISSRVKDISLFHSQAENSGFSFIRSAKASGDPSLGAVFHLFSILTGRFQSQKPLGPAVNSVPQVSPPSLRSSPPRNIFWGIKTTWWSSTAQNVIQPFPWGSEGEMQGGWFASTDNTQDVMWKQKLTCESQPGAKQAGNPGLSQATRGELQLCAAHTQVLSTWLGRHCLAALGWSSLPKCFPLSFPDGLHNLPFNRALGHCLVMSWNVLQSPAFWTNVLFFSSS